MGACPECGAAAADVPLRKAEAERDRLTAAHEELRYRHLLLAAENRHLLATVYGQDTAGEHDLSLHPMTRLMLAAYDFAVAYEAWNEGDFGECSDEGTCLACQKEEPLRLAKGAAYEAWRKARDEANGGDDE